MTKALLKLIGHRWENSFSWGEFYFGGRDLTLKWTDHGGGDQSVFILCLPFLFRLYLHTGYCEYRAFGEDRQYGFYYFDKSLVICLGKKLIHIDMPWSYEWESTELLDYERNRVTMETRGNRAEFWGNGAFERQEAVRAQHSRTYDYTYTLKDGTVQNRTAVVSVERRTWHMRGWPWKKLIHTTIDVRFNDEVGERTGSWKGGTIGWATR